MKARAEIKWAAAFAAVCLLCVGIIFGSRLFSDGAQYAKITVNGELVRRVELSKNTEFTVETDGGFNTVRVEDGKIAVTAADCPDGLCVKQGFAELGLPIVCLPHRLVIELEQQKMHGI